MVSQRQSGNIKMRKWKGVKAYQDARLIIGTTLYARFNQTCDINDMNDAISAHWEALSLRPAPHPNHSDSLDNLATVLSAHFDWTSDIVDINEAVSLHQDALKDRKSVV